jgi:hypothetical protein
MKGVPYRHIGGAVVADHGPMRLAMARDLAGFYQSEGHRCRAAGARAPALVCAERSAALAEAVVQAEAWRRAAGWADPNDADRPDSLRNT